MKNLFIFCMVIALLVMNVAGVAHTDCADGKCDNAQVVKSADTGDQDGKSSQVGCDHCLNCSHHHSNVALSHVKAEHFSEVSKTHRSWDAGATYLSQLHYPPSKPPKA
jgi:hypothetical protein